MFMAAVEDESRPAPATGPNSVTPDDKRREKTMLARYARTRDPELLEELTVRFMPLARSMAMRYRQGSEPLEDLVQVANLGLMKAFEGFDPDRGRAFTAYAVPTILGELRRHFRDHVWNVRLPRGLQELAMRIDEAVSELTEELGRHPTPAQVAERLGVAVEDVLEGLEATHARRTLSLDAPRLSDEQSTPTIETIGSQELGFERVESGFACAAGELTEREWSHRPSADGGAGPSTRYPDLTPDLTPDGPSASRPLPDWENGPLPVPTPPTHDGVCGRGRDREGMSGSRDGEGRTEIGSDAGGKEQVGLCE